MKKLSKNLNLNKQSVQILDDKTLIDIMGGADRDATCNENSCNANSCWYWSCKQN